MHEQVSFRRWSAIAAVFLLAIRAVGQQPQQQQLDPTRFSGSANDRHFQQWRSKFEQRAYPLGHIPAGARLRALEQIEQHRRLQTAAAATFGPAPLDLQTTTYIWRNIGPAPIQGFY